VQFKDHPSQMRMTPVLLMVAAVAGLQRAAADTNAVPPVILQPPQDVSAREGEYAEFTALADGTSPLSYTWVQSLTNATNSIVTLTPALQLFATTTNEIGTYSVIVTNVAGAVTSQVAALQVRPYTPREWRVAGFQTNASGQVVFPLDLAAQGDEHVLAGSLRFAPNVLQNPAVTLGTNTNITLQIDTSQTNAGALGLTVSWPAGLTATAGVQRLASLTCDLVAGAAVSQAALAWTNQPVAMGATDVSGASLLLEPMIVPAFFVDSNAPSLELQTGLFLKTGTLINPGGGDLNGVRIRVLGLTNDSLGNAISVRTAAFDTNSTPCLQYGPVWAGASNTLTFEYYLSDRDRRSLPTNTFDVYIMQSPRPLYTTNNVTIGRALFTNSVFIVEFPTASNYAYYVQYRTNLSAVWQTSLPAVVGTGNRVQWVDRGPPRTASPPASETNRFYHVFW